MTTLATYRAETGLRELVFVTVPDEPGRTLLLDAAAGRSDPDDVVIVDEGLSTIAEARAVARGWAGEETTDPATLSEAPTDNPPAAAPGNGRRRILGGYRTDAGDRLLVGGASRARRACSTSPPATRAACTSSPAAWSAGASSTRCSPTTSSRARAARHPPAMTFHQLSRWAARRPREVSRLNGEFEFIAITTPEVAET